MENGRINVINNWNYQLKSDHKESGFGKSLTQPNDVLSVEEIIRRSANGIPLGNMVEGHYDDPDVDLPDDYYSMDKLEKMQYARDRSEELNRLKKDYEESRKGPVSPPVVGDEPRQEDSKVEDSKVEDSKD